MTSSSVRRSVVELRRQRTSHRLVRLEFARESHGHFEGGGEPNAPDGVALWTRLKAGEPPMAEFYLWDFALRNLHVDRDGDYVRISLTREQCDAAGRSMFAWRHRFSPG